MVCSKCCKDLEALEFKHGRQCIQCVKDWHATHYKKRKKEHKEQGTRWRKANPDKQYIFELRCRLKKHGIQLEHYYKMLAAQDNKCAVCKSIDPKRKNAKGFFIDHDHKTGRVRGLLCHRCNLAAGWMEDNLSIIDDLKQYLFK